MIDSNKNINDQDIISFDIKGFCLLPCKTSETQIKLLNTLQNIDNHKLKPNSQLSSRYKNTLDLSPSPSKYDDVLLDFVKENKFLEVARILTGKDLVCCHTQLRIAGPNSKYLSWHRDNHAYKNRKVVGNFPSVYKLIFYPCLDHSEKQLAISSGSHRKFFTNKFLDFAQIPINKKEYISSNNSYALLFNTQAFHNVVKTTKSAMRLIYSFVPKNHIHRYGENPPVHLSSDLPLNYDELPKPTWNKR